VNHQILSGAILTGKKVRSCRRLDRAGWPARTDSGTP